MSLLRYDDIEGYTTYGGGEKYDYYEGVYTDDEENYE